MLDELSTSGSCSYHLHWIFQKPFSCYICNSLIDTDCSETLYTRVTPQENLQKHVFWCKNLTTAMPYAVQILGDVTNATADEFRPACLILWLKHREIMDKHDDERMVRRVIVRSCALVKKKEFKRPGDYLSGDVCSAMSNKNFAYLNCELEKCTECFTSLCNAGTTNRIETVTMLIFTAFYSLISSDILWNGYGPFT
uniref:Tripartite motif-containing protein 55 n=1 Tax=Lygus hesperus TaxID=30085 RepID=A0A0A9X8K4_LYGHE